MHPGQSKMHPASTPGCIWYQNQRDMPASEIIPHGKKTAIALAVAVFPSVLHVSSFQNRTRFAGLRFGFWRKQLLLYEHSDLKVQDFRRNPALI